MPSSLRNNCVWVGLILVLVVMIKVVNSVTQQTSIRPFWFMSIVSKYRWHFDRFTFTTALLTGWWKLIPSFHCYFVRLSLLMYYMQQERLYFHLSFLVDGGLDVWWCDADKSKRLQCKRINEYLWQVGGHIAIDYILHCTWPLCGNTYVRSLPSSQFPCWVGGPRQTILEQSPMS